jgi:hypothetical protein
MVDCDYGVDEKDSIGNKKQAIAAATFLIYILYNIAVVLAYVKKDTEVSYLKRTLLLGHFMTFTQKTLSKN